MKPVVGGDGPGPVAQSCLPEFELVPGDDARRDIRVGVHGDLHRKGRAKGAPIGLTAREGVRRLLLRSGPLG